MNNTYGLLVLYILYADLTPPRPCEPRPSFTSCVTRRSIEKKKANDHGNGGQTRAGRMQGRLEHFHIDYRQGNKNCQLAAPARHRMRAILDNFFFENPAQSEHQPRFVEASYKYLPFKKSSACTALSGSVRRERVRTTAYRARPAVGSQRRH